MRLDIERAVTHRWQDLVELDVKLHEGIVVAVMHYLPVNQPGVYLTRAAEIIRDFISLFVQQAELAGAQTYRGVDHFLTRPGREVKHHQFVFLALRHVVDNLAHIEARQVISHVFRQLKA
ncbi:Uncharacterised protein [Enterobacter cloacae]|nr:Uncharacterised protein [Enterobacter cloacae]